jgi:hypothetical protein
MYFWEDVCVPVLVIGGMLGAMLGLLFLGVNLASSNECSKYASLTGAQTYFDWSTGCLVKTVDQKWISLGAATKNNADVTVHQK